MTELILSHFAIRNASFRDRVAVAARHGFVGIALHLNSYEAIRASGTSDAELVDVLAEHDVRVHEYEALRGWGSGGADQEDYERRFGLVEQAVAAFGPPSHIQVVGPYDGSLAEGAAAFGALCDRLADLGTRAAVEYLPQMTNIPDARAALDLIEAADRDNGGLCLDSWHHERSGEGLAALTAVPLERVFGVQFDDGPPTQTDPDYRVDCMSNRQVPGEGSFDLVGFVRTLDGLGVDLPYAIEVISLELDELPIDEAVARMAAGTRAVLAEARA